MTRLNERVKEIFDEWDVQDSYARIMVRSAEGIVKGEVKIKQKGDHSTAMFSTAMFRSIGIEVTIENGRGRAVVYIPQKKVPPISELVAMENSRVKYESETWSSAMEGTSVKSRLKFLEGTPEGKTYEGIGFS